MSFLDTIKDLFRRGGSKPGKPVTYTYLSPAFVGYEVPRGFNEEGNLTPEEVAADVAAAFALYESTCGITFKPMTSGRVDLKFVCKPINAAGNYSNGVITINSKPQGQYKGNAYGALWRVTAHELGHAMGMSHSSDPAAIMNSNSTNEKFTQTEVNWLVRKYGPPK